jgi:hypothetical protein
LRFIDDGFFILEQDEASLTAFLQMLNTLLPNIRLTYHSVICSQAGFDYMDLTINKCMDDTDVPDVRLKITTYQKPHHQYMYIPYHSFHSQGRWSFHSASARLSHSFMLSPTPGLRQIFYT